MVKTQVESQIKVRDLSRCAVSIQPAEYRSWEHARNELMLEAKRPIKAQMEHEIAAAVDESEVKEIRANFAMKEKTLENELEHKPLEFHANLGISYNFLSK